MVLGVGSVTDRELIKEYLHVITVLCFIPAAYKQQVLDEAANLKTELRRRGYTDDAAGLKRRLG